MNWRATGWTVGVSLSENRRFLKGFVIMQNQNQDGVVRSFAFSGDVSRSDTEWVVIGDDGRRQVFPVHMRLSDVLDLIGAVSFEYHRRGSEEDGAFSGLF